jgi:hypothetical protein
LTIEKAKALPAAKDTAMNPAVVDAFGLAIIAGGGPPAYPGIPGHEPDLTAARKNADEIDKAMAELRKIVADAGSFVSESNFFERSWQRSFLGSKLREITGGKRQNMIQPVSSSSTTV